MAEIQDLHDEIALLRAESEYWKRKRYPAFRAGMLAASVAWIGLTGLIWLALAAISGGFK